MKHQYYDCVCGDLNHVIRFTYDEVDGHLVIYGRLNHHLSLYNRIKLAIKYVFGISDSCMYDVSLIDFEDFNKMNEVLSLAKISKIAALSREKYHDMIK